MNTTSVLTAQTSPGLLAARRVLRERQAAAINAPAISEKDVSEFALRQLDFQTKFYTTDDPARVKRGFFSYHREFEEERIRRAREIVHRIQPTSYEDPNYFASLAYQAASIEMALPEASDRFLHYMIGTVHEAEVNAFSDRVESTDFNIAILYSGFVDLIYQFAKAVVEAIAPSLVELGPGQPYVQSDMDLQHIKANLQSNPAPIRRVCATLRHYLYEGYPRAVAFEKVLDEQGVILSPLVSLAERWALAHEYGHGIAYDRDFSKAPQNPKHAEEYFADTSATIVTVRSAAELDGFPPEVPLGSAIFALCCLELCRRAHRVATRGTPGKDEGDLLHPPNRARAANCIDSFRRYFDVQYGNREFDLAFILRRETPAAHTFDEEKSERAYSFGNILLAMWPNIEAELLKDYGQGKHLHKIWH